MVLNSGFELGFDMDTFEWKMDIIIPINTMDSVLEIDERTHEALGGDGEVQQLEALIQQLSQGKSRFRLVLTSPDSVWSWRSQMRTLK